MKCGVKTIGVDTLPFMTILPALSDMRDKKMSVLNHQDIIVKRKSGFGTE